MASTASVPATRSPFAHLGKSQAAGAVVDDAAALAAKKAEEDEKAKKEEEEAKAKKKAEDEAKAKKEEEEAAAQEDDGDDEDDEDEDEDDKKKKTKAKVKAIRMKERDRIRAIVTSEAGLANPKLACDLALNSSMPRDQALAILRGSPAASTETRTDALRDRMAHTAQIDIGVSETQSSATLAQQIVAAGKKRRGEV
jgi:archaellum component FlaD/FlaE